MIQSNLSNKMNVIQLKKVQKVNKPQLESIDIDQMAE